MRFRCARRGRNQLLVFPGKAVAFNSNPQPVRPWRALLKARSSRARAKKFLTHRTPDWQILARTIPACSTARVRLARTELDAFPDEHGQWHRQGKPGQKNDQHQGSHALTMSARAAKFRDGTNTSIRNVSREPDSCARSGGPSRRSCGAAGVKRRPAWRSGSQARRGRRPLRARCRWKATAPASSGWHPTTGGACAQRQCHLEVRRSSLAPQIPSLARWLECPAIGHKRQIPG